MKSHSPVRRPRGRAAVLALVSVTLAGSLLVPPAVHALDKAAAKWLKQVHLLILPDEEALYRDLRSSDDRREFEKIFWARRDPDPRTPANEFEEAVERARKRADDLYSVPGGERGSLTGCGQVLALLGEPLEREGRETSASFDAARVMREGALPPETWTYRSRPGDRVEFTGGELRIAFDDACRFAEGGRVLEDLRRVAASQVIRPVLDYRKGDDGHLVELETLLASAGTGGGLRAALESERADFPIEVEPHMLLRTQAGETYAAGLVRMKPGDGPPAAAADPVTVAAAVVDDAGHPGPVTERPVRPAKSGEASVASWGLTLPAGRQTLRVAVQAGDRTAVAPVTLEVPDFAAPGLRTSSLLVFPETDAPAAEDPHDAYAALTVGPLRLQPRFGNVFTPADAVNVVCVLYGGTTDPATGKASLKARFTFLKDGKPVAKGQEQPFDTEMAVASVGPVPLSSFGPGRYSVRLEVRDEQSGQEQTQEAAFEIEG